ncbi:FAD-binding-3 domain-containing protein [Mycena kentingensis (nom. inval.)]|nr:FAD-binding-3 domain-containing protein [Mycena kentingensis (nom. inval.)]
MASTSESTSIANLHIAIVGAGMGGLATALALAHHGFQHISVYESAKDLGFVGAGIQVAPNLSRQLEKLGVWRYMGADAVDLESADVRGGCSTFRVNTILEDAKLTASAAGATDEVLTTVQLTHIAGQYGQPHRVWPSPPHRLCPSTVTHAQVAHRSALANALYKGCKAFSPHIISIHFASPVSDIDLSSPSNPKLLVNSTWIAADLILGADGIKSIVRSRLLALHNEVDGARDTGQAAYRIMLTREQIQPQNDSNLLALLDAPASVRWIAPHRHIIAYPISAHSILNISTTQPDTNFASAPGVTYTTRASKDAMLAVFADFCPLVQRMLRLAPDEEVCEWRLTVQDPLPHWTLGNVALLGDACHPTLPHLGQGAAQAIEDGVVLALLLSKVDAKQDIPAALRVYERLRKPRTEFLVAQAAAASRSLHLTDPAAQAKRDEAFRRVASGGANPDKWIDREVQDFVYGFDCVADAEEKWESLFAEEGKRV